MLTIPETAARLGISPSRVHQLRRAGRLPGAVKRGRDWLIPESDLALVAARPPGRPRGRAGARASPPPAG